MLLSKTQVRESISWCLRKYKDIRIFYIVILSCPPRLNLCLFPITCVLVTSISLKFPIKTSSYTFILLSNLLLLLCLNALCSNLLMNHSIFSFTVSTLNIIFNRMTSLTFKSSVIQNLGHQIIINVTWIKQIRVNAFISTCIRKKYNTCLILIMAIVFMGKAF